ncbi:hypothetical protein HPP92_019797 [Vanilla planifolia]|uniref:Pentatricopeptide repeat-containing protein n=1 Tax=Vanilla planifolia TaxID=51239 RepID=A0A835Q760_VANPL|nr:hypothetical protein HPP92_019797 [Vanilla planifolia]
MFTIFPQLSSLQSVFLLKPLSSVTQPLLRSGTTILVRYFSVKQKGILRALEILDFVSPNEVKVSDDQCHHRLIRDCMQNLNIDLPKPSNGIENHGIKHAMPVKHISHDFEFITAFSFWSPNLSKMDDPTLFAELFGRGIVPNEGTLSCWLSSCVERNLLGVGEQLHAVAVKINFSKSCLVGSSLISFYSKCHHLDRAYQVFLMMPVRNTITWTAIISCYAKHCEYETCINLFSLMRGSGIKPNDFTCATMLSTCRSSASLSLGGSFHCLELQMGFNSYTHVLNALISMYSKCGSMECARNIFDRMPFRDLISWNSMIFAYSQYGLATEAIHLLKEMDKHKIAPDRVSFLGAISSCRHAGHVKEAWDCFSLMLEHGIEPGSDHYSCIVDLLGKAGLLEEALNFINRMPVSPCAVIWGSLLSSSRVHGNVWLGIQAAENRLLLKPDCSSTYLQLANLYASICCWDQVSRVRKLMKERGIKPDPGYSWIEIGDKVHSFKSENKSDGQINEIIDVVNSLADHMLISN